MVMHIDRLKLFIAEPYQWSVERISWLCT